MNRPISSVFASDSRPPAAPRPRHLAELAAAAPSAEVRGDGASVITDVAYRSSDVRAGSLFFCVPGSRRDGHEFAAEARERGAAALVVERPVQVDAPQVLVPSVRAAMGPMSAVFFDHPSRAMTLIGVTGTNGKTTTTYVLEAILRVAGHVPGVIGTTGVRIAGTAVPFDRTTPEAPDLQRLLWRMRAAGVDAAAMEVSSHGLDQRRVDGTSYACSIFTNLSRDHLDYHDSLESYFEAKARLFTPELSARGAVNADSPHGRILAARAAIPTVTFGVDAAADVRAASVQVSAAGVAFTVDGLRVRSRLRGAFNVSNCLGAIAAARLVGVDDEGIARGIEETDGVPGRLEPVDRGQPFLVVVDYAHTPDSVDNVLRAVRELTKGRLIVVLGCGGDRDRGKRPLMGEAAARLADLSVITSDNPRSEDPAEIIDEILPGARRGGGAFVVEPDRRAAIHLAIAEARPGDAVVIAGKGHETGQEFRDHTIPFDDRLVAAEALEALAGSGSS